MIIEVTGESKLNDSPGFNFLQVDSALAPGYPEDPLVEGFRVTLKRSDLATLSNLNWLNDEVQIVCIVLLCGLKGHFTVFLVKRC